LTARNRDNVGKIGVDWQWLESTGHRRQDPTSPPPLGIVSPAIPTTIETGSLKTPGFLGRLAS
jgi:hypothetical protein